MIHLYDVWAIWGIIVFINILMRKNSRDDELMLIAYTVFAASLSAFVFLEKLCS